jgi:hypothetical protein
MILKLRSIFLALLLTSLKSAAAEPSQPRAARSVHLGYPAPEGSLFFNQMVVEESVNGSYFMACGWNTGYFGIQQLNSPTNKVLIFSVWDPTRGDDPTAVKAEERVEVLYQGEGVRIKRFGGEGTGGQCMAPFDWKLNETNSFLIRAEVRGEKTAYTAWIRQQGEDWRKLATFQTKTRGRPLSGYYSFIEDFRRDTRSATEQRRAQFQNGWVKSAKDGQWTALSKARFTASSASWEAKETINAGVLESGFYLETGGKTKMTLPLRSFLTLTGKIGRPPENLPKN